MQEPADPLPFDPTPHRAQFPQCVIDAVSGYYAQALMDRLLAVLANVPKAVS